MKLIHIQGQILKFLDTFSSRKLYFSENSLCDVTPVSQLIWTPVDLDPRSISTSRYGPPGPNLLADMDPRGSKSASKYGPPLADLDPPSKVKFM